MNCCVSHAAQGTLDSSRYMEFPAQETERLLGETVRGPGREP